MGQTEPDFERSNRPMNLRVWMLSMALVGGLATGAARGQEPDAERGRKALLTRSFTPAPWSLAAYDKAWEHWQPALKAKPDNYDQAFMEHYGLHPAPYENGRYPMGLREGTGFLGQGIASDCLLCHGGSIAGKSYIGLGNTSLDVHAVFEELTFASGIKKNLPFTFSNARGTSEAGTFAVFLLSLREPDLTMRLKRVDLDPRKHLCEDVPAWWHLKKKKTMYHTGNINARSVRSLMQFALSPPNGPEFFEKEEATFRDIQAFLLSLSPPKYPLPIDKALAAKGEKVFEATCSKCHGTYGPNWTYPNKIVPIDVIGTDRARYDGLSEKWSDYYNKSWLAQETHGGGKGYPAENTAGYQAPPLDGIWATAPYFHNGSVPTVYNVLNSKTRPKIFTRSFKTDLEAYDPAKLGWKVQVLERGPDPSLPAFEQRKVYDTTQPGRGNAGHTFGDDLTEAERQAVIEYLKTL
jgi:mono/diheme cytochrome c family protein